MDRTWPIARFMTASFVLRRERHTVASLLFSTVLTVAGMFALRVIEFPEFPFEIRNVNLCKISGSPSYSTSSP